jgi:hypothetical protein
MGGVGFLYMEVSMAYGDETLCHVKLEEGFPDYMGNIEYIITFYDGPLADKAIKIYVPEKE